MSINSKIQWCDDTWNPLCGCSMISAGCAFCYAIRDTRRMGSSPHQQVREANQGLVHIQPNGKLNWTGEIRLIEYRMNQPLRKTKPTLYFINSLSDFAHEALSDEARERIIDVTRQADWHKFQILTKRSGILRDFSHKCNIPDNVMLGVSVENANYLYRIDDLRAARSRYKFLSLEPLLGPLPGLDPTGIDQVIIGGESGPGSRPMDLDGVREIIEICQEAQVCCFVKQLGTVWARENGASQRKGGDWNEWEEDLRIRQAPAGWSSNSNQITAPEAESEEADENNPVPVCVGTN